MANDLNPENAEKSTEYPGQKRELSELSPEFASHIHLLVIDRGNGEIARNLPLIAERTVQEYNQCKQRCGAYCGKIAGMR